MIKYKILKPKDILHTGDEWWDDKNKYWRRSFRADCYDGIEVGNTDKYRRLIKLSSHPHTKLFK